LRAKRSTPAESLTALKAGQGTSYAVATVAGIAALWLSRFGPDAVRQEASKRGISVSQLFKTALQHSARRPAGWDADNFGAGIANADALLQLPLEAIPTTVQREGVTDATRSLRRMLGDENGLLPIDAAFDWQRYGCELASIALAQAKLGAELTELTREAKSRATAPSEGLAAAINRSTVPALRKFGASDKTSISRPAAGPVLCNSGRPATPCTGAHWNRPRVD
jgi:hypothetical protein